MENNYRNTIPNYQNESVIELKPIYHTDLKASLDNLVLKEKPEQEKGLLERVFSDKTKNLKASVKALISEIKLRENLDKLLLNNIDDSICRQNTYLENLKGLKAHYQPEMFEKISKTKSQLESNILELENEKRKEYLECWRDLMFMKKYLHSALKDYWDLTKKRQLLSYDPIELTKNENSEGC